MQRKQLAEVTPRSLVALLVVLAAGVVIGSETHALDSWQILGWALASALFGALVGLSEILSRYRDEPVRAATTGAGLSYLLLNAVISLFAFGILRQYAGGILPVIKDDPLMTAIVAGFGSMTIFRSKLFTFRTPDGTEYAIGPAIVLETVLKTIDQKIDRGQDIAIFAGVAEFIPESDEGEKGRDRRRDQGLRGTGLASPAEDHGDGLCVSEYFGREEFRPGHRELEGLPAADCARTTVRRATTWGAAAGEHRPGTQTLKSLAGQDLGASFAASDQRYRQ